MRNDLALYDDLAGVWWDAGGEFAALHWLADARAALVPPPVHPGAVLLDVGCGGGLMAGRLPHGYRHVGVDRTASALVVAAAHGVQVVRGDAAALPVATESCDVVVAGEILEHVTDLEGTVREIARVLRPGGLVVIDTIAATRVARLWLVTVMEHFPGGPPRSCHDPRLFVDPRRLRDLFARHSIPLAVRGLRAHIPDYLRFLTDRRRRVRMRPTRSIAGVYQAIGRKALVHR